MTISRNSHFLKEMGITEWASLEPLPVSAPIVLADEQANAQSAQVNSSGGHGSNGTWWFFGNKPQGDAELLFNNMIRALGLSPSDWTWKSPSDNLNTLEIPANRLPIVALAFGGPAAQKLSGERDSLPELRETVLALNAEFEEEIPLIASFDLLHVLSKPKDKSLLWQDLLLARSVLQNS
jgi:uracil-DNA glycosylase